MSNAKVSASIARVINIYQAKLLKYDEEIFHQTPPIGGWSYSEVYSHIFDSSLLSTMAIENCIKGKGEDQPTHFVVKLILLMGKFPPAQRYKVPKRLEDRVKKISKTEAEAFIVQFEKALMHAYPGIAAASKHCKNKHPRLGYLNAKQWLRFIEIHLKHHVDQLNRIEESFKS